MPLSLSDKADVVLAAADTDTTHPHGLASASRRVLVIASDRRQTDISSCQGRRHITTPET